MMTEKSRGNGHTHSPDIFLETCYPLSQELGVHNSQLTSISQKRSGHSLKRGHEIGKITRYSREQLIFLGELLPQGNDASFYQSETLQ